MDRRVSMIHVEAIGVGYLGILRARQGLNYLVDEQDLLLALLLLKESVLHLIQDGEDRIVAQLLDIL